MYPRNAASPERIALGAVVQISDGAVQTSGVSVKVLPQGGAASAGGGTVGYEEGIVHYVPTQAETNYASFIVIAYKTGCIPVSQTIVTSASATAGYAGLDWAQITGATTTVNLSGTTIKTATDVETDTADIQSKIGSPAGASVSADVAAVKSQTAAIETDTQDIQTRLPAALVSGRMDASVGAMAASVLTASAIDTAAITAAKFAAGAIDAAAVADGAWQELIELAFTYDATATYAGATAGSLVKEIADNAGGTALTAAGIADAVWDEAISGHLTAGSTGAALNAAGSAGDPWSTPIPGAYGAGTAGYIVGNNLDAAITSRLASSSDGSGFTSIPWNSAWDAEVESEANDALVALNLDHLVKNAVDTNFATTVHLDSVIGQMADNGTTATFDRTTDSLEALRDRGDAAWTTATGFSTHTAADVWAAGTRTLTALDEDATTIDLDAAIRAAVGLASANMDTQFGAVTLADNSLTAAKIATGAITATKLAAGAIDAAALATDAAQEIRDSVWGKTFTELTGDPGATPAASDAVMLGYMATRNKRDTDSGLGTDEIHNNAGSVILTATISDSAGVFTKGKYA